MVSLGEIKTFFNLPKDLPLDAADPAAGLFGITTSLASPKDGAQNCAYFLRNMSKAYAWQSDETAILDLRSQDLDLRSVADLGNIGGETQAQRGEIIRSASGAISVETVPVFVGRDHSVTCEIVKGLSERTSTAFKVISFDHHLDIQHWGSALEPIFHTNVMSHVEQTLGPGRIVHIGVNPHQSVGALARDSFVSTLQRIGAQIPLGSPLLEDDQAILAAIGDEADVYISVDVDVLHRNEMTATGYPSDQGMSLTRLLALISLISRRHRIIGCDLVEFVADRSDRSPQTLADAARATSILLHLLFAISAHAAAAKMDRAASSLTSARRLPL